MSWIVHDRRMVFLHNPRTAGTSMIRALVENAGAEAYLRDFQAPGWVADHGVEIPLDRMDWPVVAFVRNPYARELSFYFWHKRHDRDLVHLAAREWGFKRFMQWRIDHTPDTPILRRVCGTQTRYLLGTQAQVLRYEDLPGAFEDRFGVPLGRSPETISPPYDPYDYYDDETMELVECYAGTDFLKYDYDPSVLP